MCTKTFKCLLMIKWKLKNKNKRKLCLMLIEFLGLNLFWRFLLLWPKSKTWFKWNQSNHFGFNSWNCFLWNSSKFFLISLKLMRIRFRMLRSLACNHLKASLMRILKHVLPKYKASKLIHRWISVVEIYSCTITDVKQRCVLVS